MQTNPLALFYDLVLTDYPWYGAEMLLQAKSEKWQQAVGTEGRPTTTM